MRYIGIGLALLVGVNTEYFARLGVWGWVVYTILIAAAVLMATVPKRS